MASEAKESGKKKNLMPIIIGVVLLLVGLVVGKSVLGGAKPSSDKDKDKAKAEVGISMPLDEFLVNLDGGGDHYLRTTISLGLKKGVSEEDAKERVAPMRDAILSVLSTKSLAELSKAKNKEAMKDEIKKKINDTLGDELVVKVYFTALATQ
jgi:flagellar FliL protein